MDNLREFDSLLHAECLGDYNCCEVVTAFIVDKKEDRIFNFITVFVMEDRYSMDGEIMWLSKRPVELSKRFRLGCQKKLVDLKTAREIFCRLSAADGNGLVDIGDGELSVGKLRLLNKVFVPQDSTRTSPLNKILKNNFRNGSYVMEFFDVEKPLKEILGKDLVKKAAEELYRLIPIDVFTISDRLGNFLFQFPSTQVCVAYQEDEQKERLSFTIETYQKPADGKVMGRYLLIVENPHDNNMAGFHSREISVPGAAEVYLGDTVGLCTVRLVECSENLIVSESTGNLIRQIGIRMNVGSQFGKERVIYDSQGGIKAEISILSGSTMEVKKDEPQIWKRFISDRQYKLRMEELDRRMEFLQYGLSGVSDREQALFDIRRMMNRGDGKLVYLWDPYLTAQDLFDTWYYTASFGLRLNCITSAGSHEKEKLSIRAWMQEQRRQLEQGSNQYGISLEFRCQWGNYGYGFHDRFLMIVDKMGQSESEVWSLGVSVNSLGTQHHIVQKVLHPQPVVDAFENLWNMLSPEECLIWKYGGE